jgi:hypothetical protein
LPNIKDLENDIKEVLKNSKTLPSEVLTKFGVNVALKLDRQLRKSRPAREPGVIRASEIGTLDMCERKFWYSYHQPTLAAPIDGATVMKFLYGDILEETVLTLAKVAGHKVEREQEQVKFSIGHYTVKGHIDAVIDGVLVDVKSTTPYGMRDFEAGRGGDKFGYRAQLNVYSVGTGVPDKGWVAVDKQSGVVRYFVEKKPYDVYELFDRATEVLAVGDPVAKLSRLPVVTEPNGNLLLDTECSYCQYKRECWKDANKGKGIRTFAYSNGPKYLVHVVAEPKVKEIT